MSIVSHRRVVWCRVTEAEELSRLMEGARYQLKLLPNKSLSLWLTFTARKEAAYNFDLPISLLGYGFSVAGCSPACLSAGCGAVLNSPTCLLARWT